MNFAIIWSGICVTRGRDGARARLGPATRLLANAFGVVTARMELTGSATHLRQGYGAAGIEGKVARVATSKLGNERVSIDRFIAEGSKGPYPDME